MKATIKTKLISAAKSVWVWLLAVGLAVTEAYPEIISSLHLAQDGFEDETYKLIVRVAFVLGILVRIVRIK